MTIKEAILKALEELKSPSSSKQVNDFIIENHLCDFTNAQTPERTISAGLGNFIRDSDNRVKRIKSKKGYKYYLTKNEQEISVDNITESVIYETENNSNNNKFYERDLHILLSSFLRNSKIYSKTIFHEQTLNRRDSNQTWTHPDMVGVNFLKLNSPISNEFLKSVSRIDTFKISSYELKKEINSDSDLKKAFFQAVSNSTWANYGYLVAFEFGDSLSEELERLSQAFGIGIIELNPNPFKSKVLHSSKYRDLDFKTIDKLCNQNPEYEQFIKKIKDLMNAPNNYFNAVKRDLEDYCDDFLENDSDIENYCSSKNIPFY